MCHCTHVQDANDVFLLYKAQGCDVMVLCEGGLVRVAGVRGADAAVLRICLLYMWFVNVLVLMLVM